MTKATILSVTNPSERGDKKQLGNLPGAALPLAIAELAKQHSSHSLLVVPDPQIALKLQAEIEQFTDQTVSLFPDWETLPYDNFSPHHEIISERIARL